MSTGSVLASQIASGCQSPPIRAEIQELLARKRALEMQLDRQILPGEILVARTTTKERHLVAVSVRGAGRWNSAFTAGDYGGFVSPFYD